MGRPPLDPEYRRTPYQVSLLPKHTRFIERQALPGESMGRTLGRLLESLMPTEDAMDVESPPAALEHTRAWPLSDVTRLRLERLYGSTLELLDGDPSVSTSVERRPTGVVLDYHQQSSGRTLRLGVLARSSDIDIHMLVTGQKHALAGSGRCANLDHAPFVSWLRTGRFS